MERHSIRKLIGIAVLTTISLSGLDGAARAQQSAIREACAGDYKSLCSGVQPGGGRIVACLQQNASKLSPSCQKALAAKAPQ
jgi:hypothetical protein